MYSQQTNTTTMLRNCAESNYDFFSCSKSLTKYPNNNYIIRRLHTVWLWQPMCKLWLGLSMGKGKLMILYRIKTSQPSPKILSQFITHVTITVVPNLVQKLSMWSLGERSFIYNPLLRNSQTGQTPWISIKQSDLLTHYGSNDTKSYKAVPFGGYRNT